jgi:hypothetical protein
VPLPEYARHMRRITRPDCDVLMARNGITDVSACLDRLVAAPGFIFPWACLVRSPFGDDELSVHPRWLDELARQPQLRLGNLCHDCDLIWT